MTSDWLVRRGGARLAQRYSRRSLLGRAGTAVVTLGAAGVYGTSVAEGHTPPSSCPGLSVTCGTLFGTNTCPSYTCKDGWWPVSGGPCGDTTYWQDCCVAYADCPSGCHCTHGADSCCNHC